VGSLLITLLKHSARVKMACLAQLVNVIAPIMTSDTGAWRQTIYYPFRDCSLLGRGKALNTLVKSPLYDSKNFTDVPYLDSIVTWDEENEEAVIFVVNKNLEEDMEVTCDLRQFEGYKLVSHTEVHDEDLSAVNTVADPCRIAPKESGASKLENGVLTTVLKHKSWNVIRLKKD
jgi:alpha-N-arabinofuranosidase